MGFILRIFFSGLIAFVPSEDGKEVTVFLIDAQQAHHGSALAGVPEHKAVLIARAAACDGVCTRTNSSVSSFLYPEEVARTAAVDALSLAVDQGMVWQLAGSDLSFNMPRDGVKIAHTAMPGKSVPDTEAERTDFGWVAKLKTIDPNLGALDPALFSDHPPEGLIVARLKLTSGALSTYSMVQVKGEVMPIDFRPAGSVKPNYLRAVASWVEAEIHVPDDSLEVVETRFGPGTPRTVSLKPSNGRIDVAILNVSRTTSRARTQTPMPGLHFARFWDLAVHPLASCARPIPQVPTTEVEHRNYAALHSDRQSELLERLFPDGRGPYDQILCPMSQYP